MAKGFSLDDYKDVAERITEFYARFPNGSLTRKGDPELREVGGKLFVIYTAFAYREPHDPHPAMGTAWEPFPGSTPYTRDSELMNAETAAWGRAIIAAGISSKKVASRQEVRNRRTEPAQQQEAPAPSSRITEAFKRAGGDAEVARLAMEAMDELGVPPADTMNARVKGLSAQHADVVVDVLTQFARVRKAAA